MKTVVLSVFIFLFVYPSFAQEPRLVLPVGHTGHVDFAAFSPDGKKVITSSSDGTAKTWDVSTGLLLQNLNEHRLAITTASFSPDGSKIVTASRDSSAILWDAKNGQVLIKFHEHTGGINTAFFSPDGRTVITASEDQTVRIWNALNGKQIHLLSGFKYSVDGYFSFDGKLLLTMAHEDVFRTNTKVSHIVQVWNVKKGRMTAELKGHTETVNTAKFSPDNTKIVTASIDKTIKIWDSKNGELLIDIKLNSIAHSADFSPDGNYISLSENYSVAIYDSNTGKLVKRLNNGGVIIADKVYFSPDGQKILTLSKDKTAQLWDVNTGKLLYVLKGHTDWIRFAQFSTDSKSILTSSWDNTAKIWDVANGSLLVSLSGGSRTVNFASYSRDGRWIFISASDKTVKIWDTETARVKFSLSGHLYDIIDLNISPDNTKVVTTSADNTARVWDVETGKLLYNLVGHSSSVYSVKFSYNGKMIVTASSDNTAIVWDALNGKILTKLIGHKKPVRSAEFSPNDYLVVTSSYDSTAIVWEVKTGKIIKTFKGHKSQVYKVMFFPDGKRILSASDDQTTKVWNIDNGNITADLSWPWGKIESVISSDGARVITATSWTPKVSIWGSNGGSMQFALNGHISGIRGLRISPKGNRVASTSIDNTAMIWDIETGQKTAKLVGHNNWVTSADFSTRRNHIVTASKDNTCKIWNTESGNLICTVLNIDSIDYISLLPTGYYQCSPDAARLLHYVTKNLQVITFEQLDIKYNRPDKVLEAISNTDTALIHSYKRAYEKRIRKLGIDTTQFSDGYSVPEADFVNRDAVEYEQRIEQLSIRIKGIDSNYKLDRFNIWINEVPLFGIKGINIRNRNRNSFDTTITINLSQGENRIETSVTNVNGTESYRMPLYLKYTAAQPIKETVHFIGIGINQFKDSKHNLQWCVKDIRDLALKFKEKYGNNIIIDTLFDQNVTLSNVQALKQKLLQTNINDKVIIAYSGHGLLSKQYDYYLSSFDVNFSKPEENGIAYEEIENLLDGIPARKKLLLLDACHSGEVDKEEMLVMQTAKTKAGNKGLVMNRGSEEETTETKTVGLQNSFELMQSLFVNVGKGTGTTIISAAGGVQFAQERNELRNGVFTYSLLEALSKNKTIRVSELKKYVGQRVEQLTDGMQKPTTRNELKDFDWNVW